MHFQFGHASEHLWVDRLSCDFQTLRFIHSFNCMMINSNKKRNNHWGKTLHGILRPYRLSSTIILALPFILITAFYFVHVPFTSKTIRGGGGSDDPFDQPFCDPIPNGVCHEKPDVASPRTFYSAWSKEQYDLWWDYVNNTLSDRIESYSKKRQKLHDYDSNFNIYSNKVMAKSSPLILLGDSITETWAGTGLGVKKVRGIGVPEILRSELSSTSSILLDPIVLGVSGDQTQHLLYRLQNGHMHAAKIIQTRRQQNKDDSSSKETGKLVYDPNSIFVIMIGTNNLGSGELPEKVIDGILAVVKYILEETASTRKGTDSAQQGSNGSNTNGCRIILFEVLPRGDGTTVLPKLCPPRCQRYTNNKPYRSFLPAIKTVNDGLKVGVDRLNEIHSASSLPSSRLPIKLVACGSEFLNPNYDHENHTYNYDENEVRKELMPDTIHPNADGHKILAKCIRNAIDQTWN